MKTIIFVFTLALSTQFFAQAETAERALDDKILTLDHKIFLLSGHNVMNESYCTDCIGKPAKENILKILTEIGKEVLSSSQVDYTEKDLSKIRLKHYSAAIGASAKAAGHSMKELTEGKCLIFKNLDSCSSEK